MENCYSVYVKQNSGGYITAVNSSAFLADSAHWVEIDRGYGNKFHHAQGNYFPKCIFTDGGAYRYKLVDCKPVECTPEEIVEQLQNEDVSKPVTLEDRIKALENGAAEIKNLLSMIIGASVK